MSALAEGSDRIVAKVAMQSNISIAPVFPKAKEYYYKTFKGYENGDVEKSVQEIEEILADKNTFTPCILNTEDVNEVQAFRELGAYLVANSHVIIAAWDGIHTPYRGGTFDTIRMAHNGVDTDLLEMIAPKSPVTDDSNMTNIHFLNADEDTMIYWVHVRRKVPLDINSDPDGRLRSCLKNNEILDGGHYLTNLEISRKLTLKDRLKGNKERPDRKVIEFNEGEDCVITSRIPAEYDIAFTKLDELNFYIKDHFDKEPENSSLKANYDPDKYRDDGYELLKSNDVDTKEIRKHGLMSDMAGRYSVIKAISEEFERSSKRMTAILSTLTVIYTSFFSLMILFSSSSVITTIYAVLFVLTLYLAHMHNRKREHQLFVGYKSLSDSLKVEFYWGMLGINDTVASNCYGYVKNGMSWMRVVLKGANSFFTNDYSECNSVPIETRLECVEQSWIGQQKSFNEEVARGELKLSEKFNTAGSTVSALITMLSVFTTIVVMFLLNSFNETLFSFNDLINGSEISVSSYTLIKLAMIILIFVSSMVTIMINRLEYTSNNQIEAQNMILEAALVKLNILQLTSPRKILNRKLGLFHELGLSILRENDDWVHDSAKKDYKRKRGLFNAVNKYKNKASQDKIVESFRVDDADLDMDVD